MPEKLKITISDSQSKLLEKVDFSAVNNAVIPKVKDKKEPKYQPVVKDFLKVDRWIVDLVIPFLNSNCSAGASVLYLDLYRMTYGYGKNKVMLTDEIIEQRTAIPKRTIMVYKKQLIEYDLISYKKGHRTKRGQFYVKRPSQSAYFIDYIQKTASLPTKSVGSTEKKPTLYNKDNLYIDSETLVFDFYKMLGRKKTRITREVADNGIKVLNKLFAEGYDTEFLRRLCEWSVEYCKQNRMNLYGIGFINYLLPEYLAEQEKITKQAKVRQKEMEKAKIRDNEMEREALLLMKYKQLPKHIKSIIMGKAKDLSLIHI